MKNLLTLITVMAIAVSGFSQDGSNFTLAQEYAKKGLFKKAVETIDLAIANEPPRAAHYAEKAVFYANLSDMDNVQLTLNIGIELFPDSIDLYMIRGGLYSAFDHEEAAIKDYETAMTLTDDDSYKIRILATMGGLKSRIRKFEEANEDLLKAYELDPENVDVLNNLAINSDEIGKPEDTFKYLQKIININPDYHVAYINLGFKHQLDGQHEKALTYFDQAIEMDPNEALAYSNRSYSRLVTNDTSGAMKDVNLSISLHPANSWAYKIRALIHMENGDQKAACEDLEKAKELGYEKRYGSEVNELIDKHCGQKT